MNRAPLTLMALWKRHKHKCRPIGQILADARQGKIPGVIEAVHGSLVVNDERATLAAIQRGER